MALHEVLVKARNLIDREGWGQGAFHTDTGGYCIEGACRIEVGDALYEDGTWDRIVNLLGVGAPFIWNDDPSRTKEEVLGLLDKVISKTAPAPDVSFIKEPEEATANA